MDQRRGPHTGTNRRETDHLTVCLGKDCIRTRIANSDATRINATDTARPVSQNKHRCATQIRSTVRIRLLPIARLLIAHDRIHSCEHGIRAGLATRPCLLPVVLYRLRNIYRNHLAVIKKTKSYLHDAHFVHKHGRDSSVGRALGF